MPRSSTRLASSPQRLARALASWSPRRYEIASRTPYEYTVTGPMLNSSGYTSASYSKNVQNHQRDADGNRRVRHVKRPEVPARPVEVDEVYDVSRGDPVDEIARGAPDDEREADPGEPLPGRQHRRIQGETGERRRRHDSEDDRFQRKVGGVHQAERCARVVDAGQIEKAGNHGPALKQVEFRPDDRLGGLVEDDDEARDPQFKLTPLYHS